MNWRNRKILLSRDPRFAAADIERCVFELLSRGACDVTTLKLECYRGERGAIMCEASADGADEGATMPKIEPELR